MDQSLHARVHVRSTSIYGLSSCRDVGRLSMRAWFVMLRDKGISTADLSKRIRRHTRRPINIEEGKRLLAARKVLRKFRKEDNHYARF